VVAQGRAARSNRLLEHRLDRLHQRLRALVRLAGLAGDAGAAPLGRKSGAMECLAHVDVAKPGDNPLVGQRGFQRGLLTAAEPRQAFRIERGRERLRTETIEQRLPTEFVLLDQLHHPETPRIIERNDRAR
jgi:hypothetical protein